MKLFAKSATELKGLLQSKEVSSREVVDSFLERIESTEKDIGAFITVVADEARQQAEIIDKKRMQGEPLAEYAGIPVAFKDNIATKGILTTCASKMLADFVPPYNATVAEKAKDSGLILLGKTNMDEFAMGSSSESSFFGPTKNPWNYKKTPGGSSGGSGAAVAAGQVPFALGSDTGGSIRLPATFCGVIGLKPTYGAVSRYGVTAFASSLDQVGPIGHTVADTAALFDIIKGHDSKDMTSIQKSLEPSHAMFDSDVKNLTIGLPKEYFTNALNSEVRQAIENAVQLLEKEGAKIKEISLPSTDYVLSSYYIISSAEASSNLARFDGIRYGFRADDIQDLDDLYNKTRSEGFGRETQLRIMLGNYALCEENYTDFYAPAMILQNRIREEFIQAFTECDIIAAPTSPRTAYALGERTQDMLADYKADIYTVTANLAGLPAISLPTGFDSQGLPMGMQFMGPHFSESQLLGVAHTYETLLGGFRRLPELEGRA